MTAEREPAANVTEVELRRYLELFHETYLTTADVLLPDDLRQKLLRYPLIRGRVVGYVSTQFGTGIEYFGGGDPQLEIKRSSSRIEFLFTGAPAAVRSLPVMFKIVGDDVEEGGTICMSRTMMDLTLEGAFPLWLEGESAAIRLMSVRFQVPAANWQREVLLAELYGIRQTGFWSEASAIGRAKDELLLAVLAARRAEKHSLSLSDYLAGAKQRMVLVLGDYSAEGETRLRAISDILSGLDYEPVLLKDIPEDPRYDLQQKVIAVGSVARFVVIDDSSRSGHILEVGRVQDNRWVAVVLRLEGSHGTFMTRGLSATSRVIREDSYSPHSLAEVLQASVSWAEERIAELQRTYSDTYPWRASPD